MMYISSLEDEELKIVETPQLTSFYENGMLLEKARGLFEIARRSGKEKHLLDFVRAEIADEKNIDSRTLGLISISFFGIAGLLVANTIETKEMAIKIINNYPETEKENLVDFLQDTVNGFLSLDISRSAPISAG